MPVITTCYILNELNDYNDLNIPLPTLLFPLSMLYVCTAHTLVQ